MSFILYNLIDQNMRANNQSVTESHAASGESENKPQTPNASASLSFSHLVCGDDDAFRRNSSHERLGPSSTKALSSGNFSLPLAVKLSNQGEDRFGHSASTAPVRQLSPAFEAGQLFCTIMQDVQELQPAQATSCLFKSKIADDAFFAGTDASMSASSLRSVHKDAADCAGSCGRTARPFAKQALLLSQKLLELESTQ